jgi:hypothetical protein
LGVEFAGDDQQLLKGRRQVAVDDDVVEKVAVVEFDPLAAADHFGQLASSVNPHDEFSSNVERA